MDTDQDFLYIACLHCKIYYSWPYYKVDQCPNCGSPMTLTTDNCEH